MVRPDLIFSYWIFGWFLLYICNIVQVSPKLALVVATIENFILLMLMLFQREYDMKYIVSFIYINTIIKIIPLIFVWRTKIELKQVLVLGFLFVIYYIYTSIFINEPIKYFLQKNSDLIHGRISTPAMKMFL